MEAHDIKEKFTRVYEREADSIFRYCFMRVHDRERALDIAQDVFAEFWKACRSDTVINHERAYLFTLAHNRIIDWYRKKKSESLDALLENEETVQPFDPADERSLADITLTAEAQRMLLAVETLEPTYRDVLYLRFTEDLTPAEIAEIVGETANTVSVRINRGLEKLKEKFHTK